MLMTIWTKTPKFKYLGIMLDSNLNWKNHVDYISKKIREALAFFQSFANTWTFDFLIKLYYAPLYPFFSSML